MLVDWNHQKIPYFSVPPTIHPSSIPSVVAGTGATVIAPGAETIGQAQILTELSKPFELAGLFGAADAGAFGGRDTDADMVDDDGFVPDPEELMDEDGYVYHVGTLPSMLIDLLSETKWNQTT